MHELWFQCLPFHCTSLYTLEMHGRSIADHDNTTSMLIWTDTNYSWVDVDLGSPRRISSLRLFSRPYSTTYIYPGRISVALHKGPAATAGRCAKWTVGTSNQVVYEVNVGEGQDGGPPSYAPSPRPSLSPPPSLGNPLAAGVVSGGPSNSSVLFQGTEDSYLEIATPFDNATADFLVSFSFKSASDHSTYGWRSWGGYVNKTIPPPPPPPSSSSSSIVLCVYVCVSLFVNSCFDPTYSTKPWRLSLGNRSSFNEGADLLDMTDNDMGFGISLTTDAGVSFGILDATGVDSVLRSHAGAGKQWTWQTAGLGTKYDATPANDGKWHTVVAQRIGAHASLELDGHIVAVEDNVPESTAPLTASTLRLGRNFHGYIDDLRISAFPSTVRTAYYDGFKGDRDGDGIVDNPEAASASERLQSRSFSPSLASLTSSYAASQVVARTFIPCLYEEMQERIVWVGTNPYGVYHKEVPCKLSVFYTAWQIGCWTH